MTLAERVPLGEVLRLDVESVAVDIAETYETAGVRSFGRGLFRREPVLGSESSYKSLSRLRHDQIVMSRLFAWEGALAIVPPDFEGVLVSPEFPTFTVDRERAIPSYIGHFVRWSRFHEQLAGLTRGLGQRRKRVHADHLLTCEIPLPPIPMQRQVAERLDALTCAANALTELARRAQELSEALVVSLATRPDLDEPAKRRAGWQLRRLGDVVDVKTFVAVDVEAYRDYPIAGVYSFGRGVIDRGVMSGSETSYKSLTRLDQDDVVVSKLGAWEGAVAVVPPEFDGFYVSSEFPTFGIDRGQVDPTFFSGIVRSPEFWALMNSGTQGSMARRKRINPSQFLGTEVWLPPIEQQAVAAELMHRVHTAGLPRQQVVVRLAALGPASLNEAFSGLT